MAAKTQKNRKANKGNRSDGANKSHFKASEGATLRVILELYRSVLTQNVNPERTHITMLTISANEVISTVITLPGLEGSRHVRINPRRPTPTRGWRVEGVLRANGKDPHRQVHGSCQTEFRAANRSVVDGTAWNFLKNSGN